MTIIDTHSHLYLGEFEKDLPDLVERADKLGIMRILMPAIDSGTHERMLETERRFPGLCLPMAGLHPCSVKDDYEKELRIVEALFAKRSFVAVGETGLDFYWDLTFKKEQYESFNRQIDWALQFGIPVVIHSRNATAECIDVIRSRQNGNLKGVFHCFSGTVEQAREIIDLGLFLGIGGVMTFKNSGLDRVVADLDMDYLVLETDAPYLAPVPYRGKRNEPAYIIYVAQRLAELLKVSVEEVAEITRKNAERLFSL